MYEAAVRGVAAWICGNYLYLNAFLAWMIGNKRAAMHFSCP